MSTNVIYSKKSFFRRFGWMLGVLLLASGVVGFNAFAQFRKSPKGEMWGYKVVRTFPHDASAFTQGLVFTSGMLLEGTGKKGDSSLRLVDLETGAVQKQAPLNSHYFGEGITVLGNQVYQLTWQNRIGLVYDIETFNLDRTFQYTGEGWGLTNDGKRLIMSDGSATLRFLDPASCEVVKRITAHGPDGKINNLNELEYVKGEIWANIWYEDRIVRLSPDNGELLGWIDLTGLYPRSKRHSKEDVLNGIAYDAESKRLFVTGKNWPHLYEISVGRK